MALRGLSLVTLLAFCLAVVSAQSSGFEEWAGDGPQTISPFVGECLQRGGVVLDYCRDDQKQIGSGTENGFVSYCCKALDDEVQPVPKPKPTPKPTTKPAKSEKAEPVDEYGQQCSSVQGQVVKGDKCPQGLRALLPATAFLLVIDERICCSIPKPQAPRVDPAIKFANDCTVRGGSVHYEQCRPGYFQQFAQNGMVCCQREFMDASVPAKLPPVVDADAAKFQRECAAWKGSIHSYECPLGQSQLSSNDEKVCCRARPRKPFAERCAKKKATVHDYFCPKDTTQVSFEGTKVCCKAPEVMLGSGPSRPCANNRGYCAERTGSSDKRPSYDCPAEYACVPLDDAPAPKKSFEERCAAQKATVHAWSCPAGMTQAGTEGEKVCCRGKPTRLPTFEESCFAQFGRLYANECPEGFTQLAFEDSSVCCKKSAPKPAPKPKPATFSERCAKQKGTVFEFECPSGMDSVATEAYSQCCKATPANPPTFSDRCTALKGAVHSYECPTGTTSIATSGFSLCCKKSPAPRPQPVESLPPIQPNLGEYKTHPCIAKGGVEWEGNACDPNQVALYRSNGKICCGDESAANREMLKTYAIQCFDKKGTITFNQPCKETRALIKTSRLGSVTATCCA